ncbi:IS3 family transposase, partial [uncultured Oscillibacter sp.]|uniref:IS3 family transposase n=1 Tax=uncultured Oscillibacter sp. TaxID=876091 RepID=UPI00266FD8A6
YKISSAFSYNFKLALTVGKCIDNGPMEGFWGILKRERYYGRRFTSREQLCGMIREYIAYYNFSRLQRRLGVHAPMEVYTQCGACLPPFSRGSKCRQSHRRLRILQKSWRRICRKKGMNICRSSGDCEERYPLL